MKKYYSFLIATILMLAIPMGMWGQTRATVTDVLNRAFTGVTSGSTSYSNWTGKTSNSDAVYAGNSAGQYDAIQLRTNGSASGIVSTTSGGKVTNVSVTWNSNTATGRKLNIYGKNTAYSAASELHNANTQGTLIGTIDYGSTTSLDITGDYTFIGIRSYNSALYLDEINITWTNSSSTTYTVTYDCNGGETDCPENVSGIAPSTSITLASAPSRPHYNFVGWTYGATTYDPGDSYTVNSNVTFVAQWESDGTYEGSICFSNQPNCTAINSQSVTGEDDLGNTWTITTTGTSSFTANSGYYQVGSGNSSATSITFTTTLDEEVNVTDFSATFGGFNATRASVVLKVDDTQVGSGTLNGAADVTISNSSAQIGTTLTAIVTPTAGGVKCYNISYEYETIDNSAVTTTTTITVPENFNTDIYQGTNAGTLTATVKDNENNTISGATVTWESSNTGVATIDANGEVTLVAVGTTTITASYAGVEDEYRPSTGTYELTVTDSNAPGTQNNPYTVAQAIAATPSNGNVYIQGIVSSFYSTSIVGDGNNFRYYISEDGTTTTELLVYKGTGLNQVAFSNENDLLVGDEVVIYGSLITYQNAPEVASGNYLYSWNRPTYPIIIANDVNLTYDATSGSIAYSITNPTSATLTATSTADWISNITVNAESVTFTTTANEGDADRTATITLSYTGATDKVINVTQAHYVPDYATLPFEFNGGKNAIEETNGLTQSGLGSDYADANTKLKFDSTDDYVILKINERPGILTFNIKGNGFSGGTFKVQTSADGVSYSDLTTYTTFVNDETFDEIFDDLNENVRYIKWVYTNKSSGNVGLGNIALAKYVAPQEYTLEVTNISNAEITVFDATDPDETQWESLFEGVDEVQVPEGTQIALSVSAVEGYVLETLVVNNIDHVADIEGGVYIFTMPANDVTISATAVEYVPPTGDEYALYTGALVEGDYLIVYDGDAMNTTVSSDRLQFNEVTATNNVIVTDNAAIVWHIAPSGQYWTIYNADADAYAASTGVKNKAQMLNDGTDDKALWTVSGTETYEFVNKANSAANVNANLRKNGTYGFACYATSTGGALSLYKKIETFPLNIDQYTSNDNGWYLIASPVAVDLTNHPMVQGTYDLYRFNPTADLEWENYKNTDDHTDFTALEVGRGYLYANGNEGGIELNFSGVPSNNGEVTMPYEGWNLVGNPLSTAATITNEYYRMNDTHTGIMAEAGTGNIGVMEGVFVQATKANQTVTFTPAENGNTNGKSAIKMNLSQNRGGVIDRAIVRFGNSNTLPKFQLFENSTKIYFAQNGEEYAILGAEPQGEMPVSFKASKNGSYTLTVNPTEVEMNYLHLIDNMTGADVDLLANPSYTFNAQADDYAARFRLVFSANNVEEMTDENETFAFINNGNLIVNGTGTLQVFDALGRQVLTKELSTANCQLSTANFNTGVYVLRLVNGNDVMTQKIIVK